MISPARQPCLKHCLRGSAHSWFESTWCYLAPQWSLARRNTAEKLLLASVVTALQSRRHFCHTTAVAPEIRRRRADSFLWCEASSFTTSPELVLADAELSC